MPKKMPIKKAGLKLGLGRLKITAGTGNVRNLRIWQA
jgi:hypothetical protein